MAKLKEDDVREVRYLARQGWLHREIADRFGISRSAVSGIVRRTTWGHLP
jgi:transposase